MLLTAVKLAECPTISWNVALWVGSSRQGNILRANHSEGEWNVVRKNGTKYNLL